MSDLRSEFLLDPSVVFLNHGSFGATPRPVFERYQQYQRELEYQPVAFIQKKLPGLLEYARNALGDYLNVSGDDLFYVPNPTFGVNLLARSLALGPGDEVLTTDLEYGACDNCWDYLAGKQGFKMVRQPVRLPVESREKLTHQIWSGAGSRTKVLFLSHITSTTALRLPVEELVALARARGILTIVDGAHAPSQIALDLSALGADFYVGACHKWMCAPKGSSFLYARTDRQSLVEPLVVGWGYGEEPKPDFGSPFLNYGSWLGTKDLSAYLAVPAAIEFQKRNDWSAVRSDCHQLLCEAVSGIEALSGETSVYPDLSDWVSQMAVAVLPDSVDGPLLKETLLSKYRIEIPVTRRHKRLFIRVSVQAYTNAGDVEALLNALRNELP